MQVFIVVVVFIVHGMSSCCHHWTCIVKFESLQSTTVWFPVSHIMSLVATYKVMPDSRDAAWINQCFLQVTLQYDRIYPKGVGETQMEMFTVRCAVL